VAGRPRCSRIFFTTLHLSNGTRLSFSNINSGAYWNNGERRAVQLPVPTGTEAADLRGVTLHTQFGGGNGGDNWNVDQVILEATLSQ
jgi:hypothetical protein